MTKTEKILKKVIADYDRIAGEFDTSRQYNWPEFQSLDDILFENMEIADIGCGNGRLNKYLETKLKNYNYTGVEKSKKLLTLAQKNNPNQKFIEGDILSIPLKDNKFQLTASIAVIHHLPSPNLRKKSIEELERITEKNGKVFLTVWNLNQPKYKKYLHLALIRSIITLGYYHPRDTFIPWGKTGVKRYYYAFKEKEIEKIIEQSGLKIIKKIKDRNFGYLCQKI